MIDLFSPFILLIMSLFLFKTAIVQFESYECVRERRFNPRKVFYCIAKEAMCGICARNPQNIFHALIANVYNRMYKSIMCHIKARDNAYNDDYIVRGNKK